MWRPLTKSKLWQITFIILMCGCESGHERQWSPRAFADDALARALATAAVSGDVAEIDSLVASGADVNAIGKKGITPLMLALMVNSKPGYERLLKHGADPNYQSTDELEESAPLFCAIFVHDLEAVRLLLAAGADVDRTNGAGQPPMEYAVIRHHWDILDILLENGADIAVPPSHYSDTVGEFVLTMPLEIVETHPDQIPWYEKVIEILKEKGVKDPMK